MFAGDVGAVSWSEDYSYHSNNNIHFISSGMGEGRGDNFLMIDVQNNTNVKISLIPIEKIKILK